MRLNKIKYCKTMVPEKKNTEDHLWSSYANYFAIVAVIYLFFFFFVIKKNLSSKFCKAVLISDFSRDPHFLESVSR